MLVPTNSSGIRREKNESDHRQTEQLHRHQEGRQTYSYEYDMSGVRSVKIADGLRHEYVTQNGQVVRDYVTNADTGTFVRCLDFFYDQSGRPFAMRKYRDSTLSGYDTYHYVLNAQGDVVQLNYQGKQNKVYAQYSYDAWGNVLTKSGSLADVNPLRYRGYYCDTETGFYYLQSRYYDPIVKRFLNADSYGKTGQGFTGYNMFAYCNNSPAIGSDPSGHQVMRDSWMFGGGGEFDYGYVVDNGFHPSVASGTFVDDIKDYIYNNDEDYCKNHFFSFYKGVPVFNVDLNITKKLGLTSWSFGIVVINNEKGRADFKNTLRHEYGHTVQLSDLGPIRYFVKVVVPSVIYNIQSRGDAEALDLYLSLPWERPADYYGGVCGRKIKNPLYNDPEWIQYCLEYSR